MGFSGLSASTCEKGVLIVRKPYPYGGFLATGRVSSHRGCFLHTGFVWQSKRHGNQNTMFRMVKHYTRSFFLLFFSPVFLFPPSFLFLFSPTAGSFGVSAKIGSGVVRGGPEIRFHEGSTGSTRVPLGFHPGSTMVPRGSARAAGWCEH